MVDKILAKELVEYTKYDKQLAWQRVIPWVNNFAQKKAKGVFNKPKAIKALADYLFPDAWGRYLGRRSNLPKVDKDTKMLYGSLMLTVMMPRIKRTVTNMKKLGLNKGKLVTGHRDHYTLHQ